MENVGDYMGLMNRIHNKLAQYPVFKKKYCCVCEAAVGSFLPYREGRKVKSDFLSVVDIVGSDVINFSCPRCWSHDRERHLFLYMDAEGLFDKCHGAKILHFAPEVWLSKKIISLSPDHYVKADLYPASLDIEKVNMLNIQYHDESFDFVIANHILEHVGDDIKALSELYRVLKPGGMAILQTPYSARLKHTFCDPGIDDEASRLEAYGQEDHVRLYGLDLFDRIESVGFISRVLSHDTVLPGVDAHFNGVNPKEPFFLFEK